MNNSALQQLIAALKQNETSEVASQTILKLLQNVTQKTYSQIEAILGEKDWQDIEAEPDNAKAQAMIAALMDVKSEKTLEELSEENIKVMAEDLLQKYQQDRSAINSL